MKLGSLEMDMRGVVVLPRIKSVTSWLAELRAPLLICNMNPFKGGVGFKKLRAVPLAPPPVICEAQAEVVAVIVSA